MAGTSAARPPNVCPPSALLGFGMWPAVLALGVRLVRSAIHGHEQAPDLPDPRPGRDGDLADAEEVFDEGT